VPLSTPLRRGRPSELATIITLAALTGMRRGELCGLQWSDINWDESTLTVRPDGRLGWAVGAGFQVMEESGLSVAGDEPGSI
jgi:integrase